MPQQDTTELKKKIIFTFNRRGPSLPVHVAKEVGLSMLFASAFLSELVSERKLKMSHMKVGNSPIYLIPGQEPMLSKFSEHLREKEKEAFTLLKNAKFLQDDKQLPAIRVALRSIRDFAVPFKKDERIIWRYFTIPESEFREETKPAQIPKKTLEKPKEEKLPPELKIFEKEKPKKVSKKKAPKKSSTKTNEKFFNKVKTTLLNKGISISSIEGFSKNDLTLKIKQGGGELILIAFNKKRITEKDIINAHKKAKELELPYQIFCLGEQTKKLNDFIDAIKDLEKIEKIE